MQRENHTESILVIWINFLTFCWNDIELYDSRKYKISFFFNKSFFYCRMFFKAEVQNMWIIFHVMARESSTPLTVNNARFKKEYIYAKLSE